MPPSPAARARPSTRSLRTVGGKLGRRIGDDVEGQRQQAVAGQDRRRLVEGLVHGRLAAPDVVVVHRRQVVMDQRIAVHAFQRRGHPQRGLAAAAEQCRALDQQKRAQPLAAGEHPVAHGVEQAWRPGDLAGPQMPVEQPRQHRLDGAGAIRQLRLEGQIRDFVHCRAG